MPGAIFELRTKLKDSLREDGYPYHCLVLPKKESATIIDLFFDESDTSGTVYVFGTTGKTTKRTAIYPDEVSGCYFLTVNAEIRKSEKLDAGKMVDYLIEIPMD